jgi:hypothetical protein
MNCLSRLAIAVVVAGLGACSTLNHVEPTSGPIARVRFASDFEAVSVMRVYDDSNCEINEREWFRLRKGPLVNSTPARLGLPAWDYHENAAKELRVLANKPIHGLFKVDAVVQRGIGTAIQLCGIAFSYVFEEGKDYEVRFGGSTQQCNAVVSQLSSGPYGAEQKQLTVLTNRSNSQGCAAAFRRTRVW